MYIESFRIQNYKCFIDTGIVRLATGFNIFIGRNDVGKSALIEALSLRHAYSPHRSLETVRTPTSSPSLPAPTTVSYDLSPQDLEEYFTGIATFNLPSAVNMSAHVYATFQNLLEVGDRFDADWTNQSVTSADLSGLRQMRRDVDHYLKVTNLAHPSGLKLVSNQEYRGANLASYSVDLATWLRNRSFAFRAERLALGRCQAGPDTMLLPNAQNLAEVLNVLSSGNPARYRRLMEHVRTVFPHITGITSVVVPGNQVEARVWSVSLDSERSDLSVPLDQSGTGIGQVLAILYVVVTSDRSSVILIDEPQSFLHPGLSES